MGRSTGELALMMERMDAPERLGVCLDTCHVFAAGYDMRSPEAWERTVSEFTDAIGLEQIRAMHVNDSLKPLGSHRDRHAHIGEGEIGDEGFRNLMRDPRFRGVPKVLETPKENEADRRNLQRLRHLAGSD